MLIKRLKVEAIVAGWPVTSYCNAVAVDNTYDILDQLVERYETAKYITEFTISDGGKIIVNQVKSAVGASQDNTELLKERCRELYALHENYAHVAKLVGKNPTTVRSWLNARGI